MHRQSSARLRKSRATMVEAQCHARIGRFMSYFGTGDAGNPHVNRLLVMTLDGGGAACFDRVMSTVLIEIRQARAADASAVAAPMTTRGARPIAVSFRRRARQARQPPRRAVWDSAIRKGSRISVLQSATRSRATRITAATAHAACITKARSTKFICVPNPGTRLWPQAVLRRTARSRAERIEEHGGVGAVGQRTGGRVLPRARRPSPWRAPRNAWRPHARQGRVRLGELRRIQLVMLREGGASSHRQLSGIFQIAFTGSSAFADDDTVAADQPTLRPQPLMAQAARNVLTADTQSSSGRRRLAPCDAPATFAASS